MGCRWAGPSISPHGPGPRRTQGAAHGASLQVAGAGACFPGAGVARGPLLPPSCPPPRTSGGRLDGVGAGSMGHSILGPTFWEKKKKSSPTLCGEIYPRAVCWGSWALQARGLLGRKQGRGFQATGGSRTPLQGSSAKIKRELAAEGSGGREGG